ncbi:MAG: zinc ribbon domain-containing protein [Eubacterium aggregans]|uniref:Zinc-ribbon domain-containing protein n=1 Tax=Eubacterium aggregans TaxID=81409 RepID=A0A1H4C9L7_9FIRM|nr:zinc ribbon domain-containing protein [Eubacterium aggregans]MDD4691378.1 zinc ribbon domain-containing protein [Eubacterium aggregans]MEA5073617.1 zinc ribbon domain-containing protein [Eubacterium aggregans]SEA57101.1 hypothetical protein SAMN04515656_11462 [Eubacterium aggregans]
MARYCPKCYVAIDGEDVLCKNCGTVLKPDLVDEAGNVIEEPTAEALGAVITEELANGDTEEVSVEPLRVEANDSMVEKMDVAGGFSDGGTTPPSEPEPPSAKPPVPPKAKDMEMAPVITMGEWVWTILLLMIPVVNIVMLIIWAATGDTNPNKRYFARAELIWMAVGIVLSLMLWGGIMSIVIALAGVY